MDDEEFETFQRVEQFGESDFEAMVTPQLLAKEDRGENLSAPFGIGLEVSTPLAVGGGKPKQSQNQRRQRGDEQQTAATAGAGPNVQDNGGNTPFLMPRDGSADPESPFRIEARGVKLKGNVEGWALISRKPLDE